MENYKLSYIFLMIISLDCKSFDKLELNQFNYGPVDYNLFDTKVDFVDGIDYLNYDENAFIAKEESERINHCKESININSTNFIRLNFKSIRNYEISSIEIPSKNCFFYINYDLVEFSSNSRFIYYRIYPKKPENVYSGYFETEFSLMKAVKRPPNQLKFKQYKNYQLFIPNDSKESININLYINSDKKISYQLNYKN